MGEEGFSSSGELETESGAKLSVDIVIEGHEAVYLGNGLMTVTPKLYMTKR